jgi:hypothetical protein
MFKWKEEAKMADKTKTIKNATDKELDDLLVRLRKENEVQNLVVDLKRKSIVTDPFTNNNLYAQPEVSTEAPIESLYHKTDSILTHFGVGGMKWGIRRQTDKGGLVRSGGKPGKQMSEDFVNSREIKAKGYKNLSTKELKDLTSRMQLEKQLRELKASDYSKGMEAAKAILAVGTTVASIYALSTTPAGQAIKNRIFKKATWKQASLF